MRRACRGVGRCDVEKSLVIGKGELRAMIVAVCCLLLLGQRVGAQECTSTVVGHSSVQVDYDAALSAAGGPGTVVFDASGDGTLRALDARSESVLWSFAPPELAASGAHTDRMTDLAVLRFDSNNDGLIDANAGDRVWLFFGLKRAGPVYYALDVTTRTPRVLWTAGPETLPGLGDAWSTPTIARVRVGGATQNGEHFVLVLGGGYSGADNDGAGGVGNRLFVVDAATGHLLWSAGDGEGVDLPLPHMTHAVAARVTALDLDGDELADRLYAADVGGRVWRFDVWNGRSRDQLVTGGVFASLGAVEPLGTDATSQDARRFFAAPDVALMHPRGRAPWLNIAIGSGNADDTADTSIRDRFYSLRDREPFVKRSKANYDATPPIFDEELVDITGYPGGVTLPEDSAGWKLDVQGKVLSDSLTVNGVVLFTTYRPGVASACASDGSGEVYAVTIGSGAAALDLNRDGEVLEDDRSVALQEDGVPGPLRVEVVTPGVAGGEGPGVPGGEEAPAPEESGNTRCYVGGEQLGACVRLRAIVRTYWKRTLVN